MLASSDLGAGSFSFPLSSNTKPPDIAGRCRAYGAVVLEANLLWRHNTHCVAIVMGPGITEQLVKTVGYSAGVASRRIHLEGSCLKPREQHAGDLEALRKEI